jgi:hypothetical protein
MKHVVPTLIVIALLSVGCSEHYEVQGQEVTWKSWNEGSGGSSRPLTQADPRTFQVLRGGFYASDRNAVFFKGTALTNADRATFVAFDKNYAKDRYHAFHYGQVIAGVDAPTFALAPDLCEYCWKDKSGCGSNNSRFVSCKR